jgi:hypothetical protein
MEKLLVEKGDKLYLTETADGFEISAVAANPDATLATALCDAPL